MPPVMPAAKLRAGFAEHHHRAVGHVLAAVVADAFHHRGGAGVADGEALAGHAVEEGLAAGGAVQHDVADDDVLFGHEGRRAGRVDDELAAREALADVVVGVAFERQRHAVGQERAEALAGRAGEVNLDGVLGQARRAVAPGDLAAQHRAHRAVHVADGQLDLDRLASFQRVARVVDQLVVERLRQAVILADARSVAPTRPAPAGCRGSTRSRAPWPSSGRSPRAPRACPRGRSSRRPCGSPARAMISRTSSATKKK